MVQGPVQLRQHALVRDDHHAVPAEYEVRAEPAVLDVLRRDRVQVGRVVVLVEAVDDDLPVRLEVPGELVVQHHVFHAVGAEVARDLRADPVGQRRRDARPGQHRPDPAAPFGDLDRRRAGVLELPLVEVLAVWHADQGALQVVAPAVPAAGEAAGALAGFRHDAGAAVLADVVEAADAAVAAAADHDGLALALPDHVVAGARQVAGAADDLPAPVEHLPALGLEPGRVGVDTRVQLGGADVGDQRHSVTEPGGQVSAVRDVDHVVS